MGNLCAKAAPEPLPDEAEPEEQAGQAPSEAEAQQQQEQQQSFAPFEAPTGSWANTPPRPPPPAAYTPGPSPGPLVGAGGGLLLPPGWPPPAPSPGSGCNAGGAEPQDGAPLAWQRGELLGAGAFGRVYQGLNEADGSFFAVKEFTLSGQTMERARRLASPPSLRAHARAARRRQAAATLRSLEAEVALLRRLEHPNIVRYLGTARTAQALHIFLELVPGGSIAGLLDRFGPFGERVVAAYTRQVLAGLAYLHSHAFMHRDIKGANLLVDGEGTVKLADFGASRDLQALQTIESGVKSVQGTPFWMAPEVIRQTGHGRPADIWSVGCTVIEMATAKPPWSGVAELPMTALFHIASAPGGPPCPAGLSPAARDFVAVCTARRAGDRPGAAALLADHPFVAPSHAQQATPAPGGGGGGGGLGATPAGWGGGGGGGGGGPATARRLTAAAAAALATPSAGGGGGARVRAALLAAADEREEGGGGGGGGGGDDDELSSSESPPPPPPPPPQQQQQQRQAAAAATPAAARRPEPRPPQGPGPGAVAGDGGGGEDGGEDGCGGQENGAPAAAGAAPPPARAGPGAPGGDSGSAPAAAAAAFGSAACAAAPPAAAAPPRPAGPRARAASPLLPLEAINSAAAAAAAAPSPSPQPSQTPAAAGGGGGAARSAALLSRAAGEDARALQQERWEEELRAELEAQRRETRSRALVGRAGGPGGAQSLA